MILSCWGVNVTQQEIAADTYDPQAQVTDTSAMKSCPREYGFRSEELNGSIGVIREWIRKGCLVIVLQKVSLGNKYGHYRVVISYDDEKEQFTTHDPIFGSNYNITYTEFAELWKPGATFQTCNWTLLVIPENSLLTSQAEEKHAAPPPQPSFSEPKPLNPEKTQSTEESDITRTEVSLNFTMGSQYLSPHNRAENKL